MNSTYKFLLKVSGAAFLVALLLLTARPALAHERVVIGPYVVIVGWRNEPVIVGERNALVFDITKEGEAVVGVDLTMDVTVLYAGRSFIGSLSPTTTPGHYSAEILPTVRGQYNVRLSGAIEDLAIDEEVEPEEVLPARVLQFPESPPETTELQESIDTLTADLQTARTMAVAGIVLGALGLIAAVAGFVVGRRK